MIRVDASRFGARDAEGLRAFLTFARDHLGNRGGVASVSLVVPDLDPLAVLEAIYEPGEAHLYLERATESVSGAEAVALGTFRGADRMEQASRWISGARERIVATGDLGADFSGPLIFAAFPFSPTSEEPGTVFLPRWQVCRSATGCVAVANVPIAPGMPLEAEVARLIRAHARFSAFPDAPRPGGSAPAAVEERAEDPEAYLERVAGALAAIRSGEVEKAVLARWLDVDSATPIRPMALLHHLRERFPGCFAFSYSAGAGNSWIGATPERLARVARDRFETDAIAGSAPRGREFEEDTARGRALLASAKDLREHRFVVEAIRRRVAGKVEDLQVAGFPQLLRLANVQHLRTRLSGRLVSGTNPFDLAAALHPTPAVGGVPREAALDLVSRLEGFDRGIYAGFLGWLTPDGSGEWVVAIRSARVTGSRARLFAGAGIVDGSRAAAELAETDLKLAAIRSSFFRDGGEAAASPHA